MQFFNHNFTPQITLPTRITEKTATPIDNIFINSQTQKYNSGNITTSISDHLPQFIIIENGKEDNPANKTAKTTYRDYKNFDMDFVKIVLQRMDWTFATHTSDVNLGFEDFLWFFNTTLDKHATIKELTRKEEKGKLKPWVTKGIKKSILVRDKIYKQMIKENDQLIKTEKHKKCKEYRNKITDHLKTSIQAYYNKCFEENEKNCRALWIGIK